MMKTSWGKPVSVIAFIRTLLIVLAVAVCTVAAEDLEALRKKALAGYAVAQYDLGWMYYGGNGVPEDYAEAVTWFRKAVEQGGAAFWVSSAQYNFGFMYYYGQGVPHDDAEALKWWRKAAEQGVAEAQSNLGDRYQNGWGVPEDYVVAYAWFSVAAMSGNDFARMDRDLIKRKLTPSQLEKGEVMAREISERIEKRKAAKGE
jgi:TPR repeat protein